MARIASLSVLTSTDGQAFLAEGYGKVLENIQTGTISSKYKNMDLSGNAVSGGTVEAKRFVNSESEAYGTAREGGKGKKVKADPVTVAINTDRELVAEVENKDVALYGVDDFVERKQKSHKRSMKKELEKAFFAEAVTGGTAFTPSAEATEVDEIVDEAIVALETTRNKFVDGVDRDLMVLVLSPSYYTALQAKIDKLPNGDKVVQMFHEVKVEKSTDLPAGTDFVLMVEGTVAQPLVVTLSPAANIPLSNAKSFGIFFSYGTKTVAKDLILAK